MPLLLAADFDLILRISTGRPPPTPVPALKEVWGVRLPPPIARPPHLRSQCHPRARARRSIPKGRSLENIVVCIVSKRTVSVYNEVSRPRVKGRPPRG